MAVRYTPRRRYSEQWRLSDMHPLDDVLRVERMPHIWCPGCGLGIDLACYLRALKESGLDMDKVTFVSGIGCSGRAAGYVSLDSFHVTHGRAIPFATGLKIAKPELTISVFGGDGDIFAIGGNHFIHAARRNMDLNVICVNNSIYGMTGGQVAPGTPLHAKTTTTPYGNYEHPFNFSYMAAASGATYVARWTTAQPKELTKSMKEALLWKGFSFIEVVSMCPTTFGRRNGFADGLEMLKDMKSKSVVKNFPDLKETDIGEKIIVGKFVEMKKESYLESRGEAIRK
jgi:2-oxoglutarate ferredoxin oxidoreductase subunit beta